MKKIIFYSVAFVLLGVATRTFSAESNVAVLLQQLRDSDQRIKYEAIKALLEIGPAQKNDENVRAALYAVAQGNDPLARRIAADATPRIRTNWYGCDPGLR